MLYEAVFIILCLINLMPVNDLDIEASDLVEVVVAVSNHPYTSYYSNLFPIAKIAWILALLAGLAGWSRIFCLYGFVSMILIGTFQTMGTIPDWEFVWLVSFAVAIYIVAFYFLWECIIASNKFSWSAIPTWRLCLLLLLPFLVWCPVSVENQECRWNFSLQTLTSNDAGASFCMVSATLLIVMILFYPNVNRRLFGVLVLVTSILGTISLLVYLSQKMYPMVIMHLVVLLVASVGYVLYFTKEKEKKD